MTQFDYSQVNGIYPLLGLIVALVIVPIAKELILWLKKKKQKKSGEYVDLHKELGEMRQEQKAMSDKLDEHIKREIEQKECTDSKLVDIQLQTMGIQIMNLIHFSPQERGTIENLCQKYISSGGNGHVKLAYETWKNETGKQKIARKTA